MATGLEERIDLRGRTLRAHAARGVVINALFSVGFSALALLRGFVLARFVGVEDYGLWGILVSSLGLLGLLKQAVVQDRFVQQDDPDQRLAFQRALGVEVVWTGILGLLALAALPALAAAYGQPDLVLLGLVALAALPATVLQAPLWVLYRRMAFVRQRVLQAADPIVGFAVAVGLALAGAGVWSLVGGVVAGAWAAGALAVAFAPHPLRPRIERAALRAYAGFSWPLVLSAGATIIVTLGAVAVSTAVAGVAGAGAVTLAATVAQFSDRVDQVVTATLYPAICAVADRLDTLRESFVKTNRLGLMWAVPFGVGLALFADPLVAFAIGRQWEPAVPLLQAFGLTAAVGHVGYNWGAYHRARGETRPIVVVAAAGLIVFACVSVPLLVALGLPGLALGIGVQAVVGLVLRDHFLRRLLGPAAGLAPLAVRGAAAVAPAAGAVLLARVAAGPPATAGRALAELAAFALLTAAATVVLERRLLRETWSYLRGSSSTTRAGTPSATV